MHTLRFVAFAAAVVAITWTIACAIDHLRPEAPAPDSYYPGVGEVFSSRAEGFTQKVIKADREHIWVELTLAPHAPGPPPHVHASFAEDFVVAKGTLSLRVGNQIKVLSAGGEFRVAPGVVHQPFNPTDEEVVIRGPLTVEYALPRDFVLFLSQVYGFMDESPAHTKPPAVLFQMSIFSPRYDAWRPSPSVAVQRFQSALLRPIARMLGYRSYYARFAPRADVAAD